jgi:Fur family ferric uptake transcriptional regulator
MATPTSILQQHQLRVTSSRTDILQMFLESDFALSELHIEKKLGEECDRVTIYRTLKTFLEKGILHKVLDENNVVKYALCRSGCEGGEHQHEHVHFKCQTCGDTSCLNDIPIQDVTLPKGYKKIESNLLILGICKKCL